MEMSDSGGAGLGQNGVALVGLLSTIGGGFLGKFWDHLFGGRAAAEKQRAEARKLLEDAFDAKSRALVDAYGKMVDDLKEFYENRITELHGEIDHWRGETIALRKALDAIRARAAGQQGDG
ncbi:hypothetical protein CKO16_02740 [Rhodoblastus acidophilus]|nr:hypothetical protein CKO16_02740 [Rhodoblastus acidophilus]